MPTLYNVNKSFQGVNSFGTHFCANSYSATLAANTDTTLTIPGSAVVGMASAQQVNDTFIAVFHYPASASLYVALNTAAAQPAGAAFAATTSVLNPTAKVVKAGDVIHFKCVAGCDVTVELFSTQAN